MNDRLNQVIIPQSDYILEVIDDEILLYHPNQTQIIYCNQTASLIWQLSDGQRTVADIIALLQAAYPEAGNVIAVDVEQTVDTLLTHQAIELVDAHAA